MKPWFSASNNCFGRIGLYTDTETPAAAARLSPARKRIDVTVRCGSAQPQPLEPVECVILHLTFHCRRPPHPCVALLERQVVESSWVLTDRAAVRRRRLPRPHHPIFGPGAIARNDALGYYSEQCDRNDAMPCTPVPVRYHWKARAKGRSRRGWSGRHGFRGLLVRCQFSWLLESERLAWVELKLGWYRLRSGLPSFKDCNSPLDFVFCGGLLGRKYDRRSSGRHHRIGDNSLG